MKRFLVKHLMMLILVMGLVLGCEAGINLTEYDDAKVYHVNAMIVADDGKDFFEFLRNTDFKPGDVLRIHIESGGGAVLAMYSITDQFELLKAKGIRIVTECFGMCGSAAGWIWLHGDERVIGKDSFLMIHSASNGNPYNPVDDFVIRINQKMVDFLVTEFGWDREDAEELFKNNDAKDMHWFGSEECIEKGFATEIAGQTN